LNKKANLELVNKLMQKLEKFNPDSLFEVKEKVSDINNEIYNTEAKIKRSIPFLIGEGYSRAIENTSLNYDKNTSVVELLEEQRKRKLLEISKSPRARDNENLSPRDGKFSRTS